LLAGIAVASLTGIARCEWEERDRGRQYVEMRIRERSEGMRG
jgi:hypothetical protein